MFKKAHGAHYDKCALSASDYNATQALALFDIFELM